MPPIDSLRQTELVVDHVAPTLGALSTHAPSRHLRWLRDRVPDVRLFAPRVSLALSTGEGAVLVNDDGDLPAADLPIDSGIAATARWLMERHRIRGDYQLRLLSVRTGAEWFEEDRELGPLQPIWIVLEASRGAPGRHIGLSPRPAAEIELLAERDLTAPPSTPETGGEYVRAVRAHVGRSRIFYPWAGFALSDPGGRVFLVRAAIGSVWHCPGGGLEIGERPSEAASRELEEETGLRARPDGLVGCWTRRRITYENGDRVHAIAILMRGQVVGGAERTDRTGEIDARGWFAPEALPPLKPPWNQRIRSAVSGPRHVTLANAD